MIPHGFLSLMVLTSLFFGTTEIGAAQQIGAQAFHATAPPTNMARLSISKRYLAYADSNVIISQLLTDTLTDSIYFFSEYIEYDKNLVEFIDVVNGARTPRRDWTITKTATTPGIVLLSAVSSGAALNGPGEILRFLFHVLDTARPLQTADFSDSDAIFGTPLETTVISDTGELRIIDACTPILVEDGAPLILSEECAPNPASKVVTISYTLPKDGEHVQLELYDLAGNLVRSLWNADEPAGRYKLVFDIAELPNGTYFYEFRTGNAEQLRMLSIFH